MRLSQLRKGLPVVSEDVCRIPPVGALEYVQAPIREGETQIPLEASMPHRNELRPIGFHRLEAVPDYWPVALWLAVDYGLESFLQLRPWEVALG